MPPLRKPTDGELIILRILWAQGPSTVRTVNEALNVEADRPVGYTTTLKLMQIMHEKGLLDRTKSGKTHIYHALVDEEETRQQLVDRLVDTAFGGSALQLVMQALGSQQASQDELDEIRQYLDSLAADHDSEDSPPQTH
ncbi:MAG: BlaI/MecI/CopY family transcriptional regulator [Bacteroidetes bacterium]|nr:MAG: BlaI/MecI/CopY family transcriptional regulator [Bacteroidota bacterium]